MSKTSFGDRHSERSDAFARLSVLCRRNNLACRMQIQALSLRSKCLVDGISTKNNMFLSCS